MIRELSIKSKQFILFPSCM